MFPSSKKKPAFGVSVMVGKGKPPMGGMKPKPPMDDLEGPDPVEGKPQMDDPAEESGESADEETGEGADYGAKITADIDAAGAEMGMQPTEARMAAGKFLSVIGKCLMGGDDQGADDGTIDTSGASMPGRYGQ